MPASPSESADQVQESVAPPHPRKIVLTPLTSLRFFAAVHIFLFHVIVMPTAEDLERISQGAPQSQTAETSGSAETPSRQTSAEAAAGEEAVFERGLGAALPRPLARLITRGYCSTSLFFMLSGFVLSYLYIDGQGRQMVGNRQFWLARFARVYPLHLVFMVLALPGMLTMLGMIPSLSLYGMEVSKPTYVAVSGLLSLLLLQAWCPEAALSWNFPTWALSVVVFFYAVFPWVVRWVSRRSRRALWCWFWTMPLISLAPSVLYMALADPRSPPMSFWSELVMRTPLFWLPHFLMAVILARLFNITRADMRWAEAPRRRGPSLGDLAAAAVVLLLMTPDVVFQNLFALGDRPPNFLLRHGLLAPLYALLIYDLALSRGWLARLLSHRLLAKLGEASFGIFIIQMQMFLIWMMAPRQTPVLLLTALVTVVLVGASLLSLRFFEMPVARWLKKKANLAGSPG